LDYFWSILHLFLQRFAAFCSNLDRFSAFWSVTERKTSVLYGEGCFEIVGWSILHLFYSVLQHFVAIWIDFQRFGAFWAVLGHFGAFLDLFVAFLQHFSCYLKPILLLFRDSHPPPVKYFTYNQIFIHFCLLTR